MESVSPPPPAINFVARRVYFKLLQPRKYRLNREWQRALDRCLTSRDLGAVGDFYMEFMELEIKRLMRLVSGRYGLSFNEFQAMLIVAQMQEDARYLQAVGDSANNSMKLWGDIL